VVVVSGDQHALDPLADELREEVVDELLGLGRRRRRVEDVAGDQDGVYLFVLGDRGDLVEGLRVLVHPRAAAEGFPDVPVGRVEKPHREASLSGSAATRGPIADVRQVARAKGFPGDLRDCRLSVAAARDRGRLRPLQDQPRDSPP
jgi:hypothetical protein